MGIRARDAESSDPNREAPEEGGNIGSHNDFSTFYWCAGQGGYGFQTAPAASDLLRDLIFGYKTKYTKDRI